MQVGTGQDDDRPVGRLLSRRDIIRLVGAGSVVAWLPEHDIYAARDTGAQTMLPACVVRPEQTEGPFFVDKQRNRSDVRAEPTTGDVKRGEPLVLTVAVSQIAAGQCRPLPGALVDIWSCDAQGVYSADSDPWFDSSQTTFLRGVQTSDAAGRVQFTTIYPGWYAARTVHIHFKIRTQASGRAFEFTSQWYFDETLTDQVFTNPPYARPTRRDTTNATDGIYRNGGRELTLDVRRNAGGTLAAAFTVGLDLTDGAVGRPDGRRRGGRS